MQTDINQFTNNASAILSEVPDLTAPDTKPLHGNNFQQQASVNYTANVVLFAGAASVPTKERGRPLTLTAARATAELLGAKAVIPAHVDGWAHFSEGVDEFVAAFDQAGIGDRLRLAAHGEWVDL